MRMELTLLTCAALFFSAPGWTQIAPGHSGVSDGPPMGVEEAIPTGSRIARKIPKLTASEKDGVKIMHRFSRCIADSKREDSIALLATAINSPEQFKIADRLIGKNSSCLRNASRMVLTQTLFRGGLAEALYRTDYSTPPVFSAGAQNGAGEESLGTSRTVLDAFSVCIVRANPAAVDGLLRTEPGSTAEQATIDEMSGLFPSCALQGQTLKLNILTLRAALAEAQYQWVRNQATAGREA